MHCLAYLVNHVLNTVKGFAMSMSDDEFCTQMMFNLEQLLRVMDQMSEVYGCMVHKWTVVVDVRNLGWEHLRCDEKGGSRFFSN